MRNCLIFQNTTCNSKVKRKRRFVLARTPAFMLDLPKHEDEAIYEVNERNPNVLPDRESCEATDRSGELRSNGAIRKVAEQRSDPGSCTFTLQPLCSGSLPV